MYFKFTRVISKEFTVEFEADSLEEALETRFDHDWDEGCDEEVERDYVQIAESEKALEEGEYEEQDIE